MHARNPRPSRGPSAPVQLFTGPQLDGRFLRQSRFRSEMMNKALPPLSQVTSKKPIRLILSDYDGTFTNHNNEIPKANVEGFCLAQKLGIQVGLSTGRGKQSALDGLGPENISQMDYHGYPGVFCNGSLVYGKEGEKVLDATFSPIVQKRLLDCLKRKGLLRFVMGLTADDSYCCEYNGWTLVCFSRFSEAKPVILQDEEALYKRPFNKFMLWQQHESLLVVRKELEHELADAVEFTMPYPELLELCEKGNNKGTGLRVLSRHLGLTPEEVLVVGDSENDISMFKEAGVAVAVGDAAAEVKQYAGFQTLCSAEGPLLQIVNVLKEKGLCPNPQT